MAQDAIADKQIFITGGAGFITKAKTPKLWDGKAAERIARIIAEDL